MRGAQESNAGPFDLEHLAMVMSEAIEEEVALGHDATAARPAQARLHSLVCAHVRLLQERGVARTDARRFITDMFRCGSSASYEAVVLARLLPIVTAWCDEAGLG